MDDMQQKLAEIQTELGILRAVTREKLKHVATRDDIAEIKMLIEQKLQAGLSTKSKIAVIGAVSTSITTAIGVLYALIF